jgi:hypothetical protein
MYLFQHIATPEHRLAMLEEFYRVSRDTVIVAVRVQARFKPRRPDAEGAPAQQLVSKAEVEGEFKQAGFDVLNHQDFLPGYARTRIYVLRKVG